MRKNFARRAAPVELNRCTHVCTTRRQAEPWRRFFVEKWRGQQRTAGPAEEVAADMDELCDHGNLRLIGPRAGGKTPADSNWLGSAAPAQAGAAVEMVAVKPFSFQGYHPELCIGAAKVKVAKRSSGGARARHSAALKIPFTGCARALKSVLCPLFRVPCPPFW